MTDETRPDDERDLEIVVTGDPDAPRPAGVIRAYRVGDDGKYDGSIPGPAGAELCSVCGRHIAMLVRLNIVMGMFAPVCEFCAETSNRVSRHALPGRNDPCPCGSGLKFKRCCSGPDSPLRRRLPSRTTTDLP